MTTDEIRSKIEQAMPGAQVRVTGADQHYSAVVTSPAFEGKSRIERHRMIYALFSQEMAAQEIHALSITTRTPDERQRVIPNVET